MERRGKRVTVTVTLDYPKTSKRWNCRLWTKERGWESHRLSSGDTLTQCNQEGCFDRLCQRHKAEHELEHLLSALGGGRIG